MRYVLLLALALGACADPGYQPRYVAQPTWEPNYNFHHERTTVTPYTFAPSTLETSRPPPAARQTWNDTPYAPMVPPAYRGLPAGDARPGIPPIAW